MTADRDRDHTTRGPATTFAEVADAYERARPGYPEDAVSWLAGRDPCDVVDLGAGTGKLTRALVGLGHRVTAIEPLDEMRAELELAVPGVRAIAGSAERIPLTDASADVVTCAQAFHWFDHDVALPEIARVLRPAGRLALVWNTRDDRDPWMGRLSAILGNERLADLELARLLGASGLFGPLESATFDFEQILGRERLVDLVMSRSYCAKLTPEDRAPILAAVTALFDETADESGVRLAYVTECFRATKEGSA